MQTISGPWTSPIHLVQMKNGSWRLCGDYRRLNAITVPPQLFPLLHGKRIFNNWFVKVEAYHQILMHEDHMKKTAITTLWGRVFWAKKCCTDVSKIHWFLFSWFWFYFRLRWWHAGYDFNNTHFQLTLAIVFLDRKKSGRSKFSWFQY